MDVAAQHILCIRQHGAHVISEQEYRLAALRTEQVSVILHIIHTGEGMLLIAEQLAVFRLVQHVAPGVYALFIQQVLVEQMVSNLVGGIAHKDIHFFKSLCNAFQADGNAVAAEDGKCERHRIGAEFCAAVGGDVLHTGVVPLAACHNSLCNSHDIAVMEGEALLFTAGEDGIGDDFDQIVALTDDRAAYAARSGANSSHLY